MNNRIAIVTGAASGIGQEVAVQLADLNVFVVALDVSQAGLDETCRLISQTDGKAASRICNIADQPQVQQTFDWIVSDFGKPEILCNVAAIQRYGRTEGFALEDWRAVIDVNLTGTFLMCQAALPYLLETGGNIVNVASLAGKTGIPYDAAYSASKGGVIALTKSLAKEYSATDVRINAVAPGAVDTPMLHQAHPEDIDLAVLATIPKTAHKPATAADLAKLVVTLASQPMAGLTGSVITMAGAAG